jgi:hypothetical protein
LLASGLIEEALEQAVENAADIATKKMATFCIDEDPDSLSLLHGARFL